MLGSATLYYSSRRMLIQELYASSRLEPTDKAGWAFHQAPHNFDPVLENKVRLDDGVHVA